MTRFLKILVFISISLSLKSQNEFYVCLANSDLLLVDYNTCSYQTLCNTGITMHDMAITPNETIYSTDGKKVYSIDKSNCSNLLITPTPVTDTFTNMGDWITALVALDDNYLFAASAGAILYKIDISNMSSSIVDTIKEEINDSITYWYGSGGDLTWYKGDLYLASSSLDLVKIVLDNDYIHIVDVESMGKMITPFSSIYGALTIGDINCDSDNLTMLAFENNDIYNVNPYNASLQLYCDSLFHNNVYGAASLTETSIQDFNTEISIPNIFTPNLDNINDYFKPIINKNTVQLNIKIYNRWGNLIYEETGDSFSWDGTNRLNNECNDGTYYYIIESSNICNEIEVKKGYLTLLK